MMCEAAHQPWFPIHSSSPEDPQSRTWLPDQPRSNGFNGGISKSTAATLSFKVPSIINRQREGPFLALSLRNVHSREDAS